MAYIYIKVHVQRYPILFTTDQGASKTMLFERVHDSMRPEDKPSLSKSSKLIGIGGTNISEVEKGEFQLQLGPVTLHVEATVKK